MVRCFHNNFPFPTDANNHSYLCMHMVNCICSFLQWYNLWYVSLYLAHLTIMVEVVSLYVSSHILHIYVLQIVFCKKKFTERIPNINIRINWAISNLQINHIIKAISLRHVNYWTYMCVQNYCCSISESYESTFRTILLKRWRIVSHVQEILWKHFLFSINIYATLRKYLHEMWSELIDITKWLYKIATTVGFQIIVGAHEWIKYQKQFPCFLNVWIV